MDRRRPAGLLVGAIARRVRGPAPGAAHAPGLFCVDGPDRRQSAPLDFRSPSRVDFDALTGKSVVVYGQTEMTRDLMTARSASGAVMIYEAADVGVHGFDGDHPVLRYTRDGAPHELACEFVAGCDGYHGVCRKSVPAGALSTHEREYPFGWLGILSESPPPDHELIYSYTDRGFALYTMRSPELARLYLQCAHDEEIENWPDSSSAKFWPKACVTPTAVRSATS